MAVYVDRLTEQIVRGTAVKYGTRSCHLFADTLAELHAFAGQIGCRRTWFQDHSTPHYNLTPARRAKAVKAGAIQIDRARTVELDRRVHRAAPPAASDADA